MGRRLRIFISSTMDDLVDPRDLICQRLRDYNFEPVNAESFVPRGDGSWETIRKELDTSDVLIVLSGESYGWVPDVGYGAGTGKSVTELEYEAADARGIPILAFFKRLDYGSAPDAKRDAFRKRIGDWGNGRFRGEFDRAREVADLAGRAMIELLQDHYFEANSPRAADRLEDASMPPSMASGPVEVPPALAEAVARRGVTLWVGAGVSLSAGLPAAAAFTDALANDLRDDDPTYHAPSSGTLFNAVASDFEQSRDFEQLHERVRDLLGATSATPSPLHRGAIRRFDHILTTNYDLLLEGAMALEQDDRPVVVRELGVPRLVGRFLVKLHGSIDSATELVLTESQLAGVEQSRPNLWEAARAVLRSQPVLLVGTSLRDPSIIELFESVRAEMRGWVVMPTISSIERKRLARWNLEPIEADLDALFRSLNDRA